MWINKTLFETVLADNKVTADKLTQWQNTCHALQAKHDSALVQKTKDDLSIDWLRHRVNALEKQNAILMGKATGLHFPVPEIVPTRPGSLSELPPSFDQMPSFEDIGDDKASEMGIAHDDEGLVVYKK